MKNVYFIVTLLFCLFAQGQNSPAIKIYLEDAETGKNIPDAKVTLEGFEIPAITGKYNQKEKYYYFAEIPTGYNTIMAYHKKYNEKGFQDTSGLPKELKLKLYDPLNVSYSFESNPYKQNTQHIYVEDPYKFAIFSDTIMNYNLFRDYLYKEIEKLNLDIEFVNPYLELCKNKQIPYCFRECSADPKIPYPEVKSFNVLVPDNFVLPMQSGYSTSEYYATDTPYGSKYINIAFYFRKKTSKKFKRFNDPILKKIRAIKGIISSSIIIDKFHFNDKNEDKRYKNYFTKKLDKKNKFKGIDSSKVFFYYNFKNTEQMRRPNYDRFDMKVGKSSPVINEMLICYEKDIYKVFTGDDLVNRAVYNYEDFSECKKELFYTYPGTGLGILDQYEKIRECGKNVNFAIETLQLYRYNLNYYKRNEELAH
jgi:hypothetical protein